MGEKLDKVLDKLGGQFDIWLDKFEQDPIRTAIKVIIILWVVKKAKALLK